MQIQGDDNRNLAAEPHAKPPQDLPIGIGIRGAHRRAVQSHQQRVDIGVHGIDQRRRDAFERRRFDRPAWNGEGRKAGNDLEAFIECTLQQSAELVMRLDPPVAHDFALCHRS